MLTGHSRKMDVNEYCLSFLAFFSILLPCVTVCGKPVSEDDTRSAYESMELFTEALLHIKKQYVEEKTYEDIIHAALRGMLKALDSHSSFMAPEEYKAMQDETAGKFSGIGIRIGFRNNILTVIAPIEDTPAFRAGLQPGDRIVEIEGVSTRDITIKEAVKKLRGPKKTRVTMTIQRIDGEGSREVEIERDNIYVPSIKGARMITDSIGYIRITQFTKPTSTLLQNALDELTDDGLNALVLDLRSNPGGLLESAIDVSRTFLRRRQLIVTTKGREGVHNKTVSQVFVDGQYLDLPVAILINRGTASASEIVAGALRDHQRAVLVGETTFGKGSVQSIIRLKQSNGKSAVRLTTARYYTPSGREIHEKGIEPDILVVVTPKEWRNIQIRRAHIENPDHFDFTDEDRKKYSHVVDLPLQRAVDVLHAVNIFEK